MGAGVGNQTEDEKCVCKGTELGRQQTWHVSPLRRVAWAANATAHSHGCWEAGVKAPAGRIDVR